jgi:hypothetical protein
MSDLKRKRAVFSIQQKLEIIKQLEKSRNAKQLALQFDIGKEDEQIDFLCILV